MAIRLIITLFAFFNLAAAAYSAEGCTYKPFRQFSFPYVIRGAQIDGFLNEGFAAYSYRDQKWQRIPLQIDEVNSRGDYVLSQGLPFTKDSDDGHFDQNDEMVVDGRDLGPRAPLKSFPPELREDAVSRWWVDLCGQYYFGSFLLVYYSKEKPFYFPPARVSFDSETSTVSTELYDYQFNEERAALLGQVLLKGANNEKSQVFEQSLFVMPLRLPWYLPNFELSNDNFVSSIESWQSGPIRSIVAVGVKLKGFLALFDLHMFSELVFYRNKFEIPTVIEFAVDPASYLQPGSGIGYAIKFADNIEWPVASNIPPIPESIDKLGGQTARAVDFDGFHARSENPFGSFYIDVKLDQQIAKMVPPPFLIPKSFFGNDQYAASYPWLQKLSGDLGLFVDFSQVRKGIYKFGLDLFLSSEAKISASEIDRPKKALFHKL